MAFTIKNFEQISYSMINWMHNAAPNISDFFVGSVVRTLLESVAMELDEIYWRTYNSLTEAQSEGVYSAFDFPREPAKEATGFVTLIATSSGSDISIPAGTTFNTQGSENNPEVLFKSMASTFLYRGTGVTEQILFHAGTTAYAPAQRRVNTGVATTMFAHSAGLFQELLEGTDYTIDTTSSTQNYIVFTNTILVDDSTYFTFTYTPLSAEVQIICTQTGEVGNVGAGTITSMKSPITGVASQYNYESFSSGAGVESDSARKSRFSLFIGGLSRGTLDALNYAIFYRTTQFKVFSAFIQENSPIPGFIKIYIADSTGFASDAMKADVLAAIEPYRGAGIIINVDSPTKVLIDVECKLRLKNGFNKDIIIAQVGSALSDHLSKYSYLDNGDYSTVYLTNLDYIVKGMRPEAIIEADISFKRQTDAWLNPGDPLTPRLIEDIIPITNGTIAEIFRPGTIGVTSW